MAKIISAIVISLSLLGAAKAQAVAFEGYNYVQVCIPGNECVINRIAQDSGISIILLKEGRAFPGLGVMGFDGVRRDPASGEWIGNISNAKLNQLKAAGLETVTINPDDLQKEITAAQNDLDDNLKDCLVGEGICVGGIGLAMGSGGLAMGVAGLACYQAYRACKTLDKANKDLFKKRDEAKAALKQYAKEKAEAAGRATGGGGGGTIGGVGGGGVQGPPQIHPPGTIAGTPEGEICTWCPIKEWDPPKTPAPDFE